MKCYLCGKSSDEGVVSEGIYDGKIVHICSKCSIEEHIPLIKHPSAEKLEHADRQVSVRERLEHMSSGRKTIARDQQVASKNLAKIRFPPKRQDDESLVDNYNWKLSAGRRRKKVTLAQLSERTGISEEDIDSLEHGQLVEDFKKKISNLELFLDINLLVKKEHDEKFVYPDKTKEEAILEEVREKVSGLKKRKDEREMDSEDEERLIQAKKSYEEIQKKKMRRDSAQEEMISEEREKKVKEIASGKFDFSKRDSIQDITLKDLQEMKKKKEKDSMLGKEVELEDFIDDAEGDWS